MEYKDLSVILESGLRDGVLTDREIESIQGRLLVLLGRRTERYTMGDSSSVPIETAEELFHSICFTISLFLKSGRDMKVLLDCEDMEAILKEGQKKIQKLVEIGKWMLHKAKEGALPIDNISYHDTIQSIEVFFKKYDIQFFAHKIPCSIDYQLCHAVPEELQGIMYINEYLRRIVLENRFCSRFDIGKITKLLEAYCPDYIELLINIYEPVATNALGIALLCDDVTSLDMSCTDANRADINHAGVNRTDIVSLDITDRGRKCLLQLFQKWDEKELMRNLRKSAIRVSNALRVTNTSDIEYLKSTAESLCPRITAVLPTQRLDGIFISLSPVQ